MLKQNKSWENNKKIFGEFFLQAGEELLFFVGMSIKWTDVEPYNSL